VTDVTILSYAAALFLLYACILLYALACKYRRNIFRNLITAFGMLPGVVGVIYGFFVILSTGNSAQGLGIMTAWLLLEMGALQLKQLTENIETISEF
jgi:hypothetical protein